MELVYPHPLEEMQADIWHVSWMESRVDGLVRGLGNLRAGKREEIVWESTGEGDKENDPAQEPLGDMW